MFETEKQMMVDVVANDVDSAVQIHETHTNVWPEIEFRETTFSNLVQAGNAMIEDGHYAANDIHERLQVRSLRIYGHAVIPYPPEQVDIHLPLSRAGFVGDA